MNTPEIPASSSYVDDNEQNERLCEIQPQTESLQSISPPDSQSNNEISEPNSSLSSGVKRCSSNGNWQETPMVNRNVPLLKIRFSVESNI